MQASGDVSASGERRTAKAAPCGHAARLQKCGHLVVHAPLAAAPAAGAHARRDPIHLSQRQKMHMRVTSGAASAPRWPRQNSSIPKKPPCAPKHTHIQLLVDKQDLLQRHGCRRLSCWAVSGLVRRRRLIERNRRRRRERRVRVPCRCYPTPRRTGKAAARRSVNAFGRVEAAARRSVLPPRSWRRVSATGLATRRQKRPAACCARCITVSGLLGCPVHSARAVVSDQRAVNAAGPAKRRPAGRAVLSFTRAASPASS